jgi:hypothetical protein
MGVERGGYGGCVGHVGHVGCIGRKAHPVPPAPTDLRPNGRGDRPRSSAKVGPCPAVRMKQPLLSYAPTSQQAIGMRALAQEIA